MRIAFIGDSFTEGLGDERPDGTLRGWADRVAEGLAASGQHVWCANFAIRGRVMRQIAGEQLDAALALDPPPELLVVNGGGNDMMRPNFSTERCGELLTRVIDLTEAAGIPLLVLSGPNPADHLPLSNVFNRRGRELTDSIAPLIAGRDHVRFVDCFSHEELRARGYWSEDGLHLNTAGHARVAAIVLASFGIDEPMPVAGDAPLPRGVRHRVEYTRKYLAPWAARRIRGKSMGDGRDPKYPGWTEVVADMAE